MDKNLFKSSFLPACILFSILLLFIKLFENLSYKLIQNHQFYNLSTYQTLKLSILEVIFPYRFNSQTGQDKWILYEIYPGISNGFFVDLGSADGVKISNTKSLEDIGWKGICIDPFPKNMTTKPARFLKK